MRTTNLKQESFVAELRCDRCGAEAQHDAGDGFNNFLQVGFDASWGSDLGDGNRIDIDLCHACLKATLGPWLRISHSTWSAAIVAEDPPAPPMPENEGQGVQKAHTPGAP